MSDPNVPPPPPPPNWYPDPHDPARLRYWDGAMWTDHFAPAVSRSASGTAPTHMAPGSPAPQPFADQSTPTPAASPLKRNLIIGGAVVLGLLLVGGFAAALSGGGDDSSPVAATVAPLSPSPTPAPSSPAPSPSAAPEPSAVVTDPAVFRSSANSHLDDMQKDLDDMVVTLDEGGFFRLLSNSFELSFNLAQLEALDVPASVGPAYADSLTRLGASIDALSDPIAASDDAGTRAAIEAVRAEVEATRGVVDQAQ